MVLFNYSVWYYLLFICYLIFSVAPQSFGQVFIALVIGELVERYGKKHALWKRPLYQRRDQIPPGLVAKWYKTGSFPSGHTIKVAYFLLYTVQYQVFNPVTYLIITTPIILFRVIVGFHYPIDILGGAIIGYLIWFITHSVYLPPDLANIISTIFNYVF